MGNNNPREMLHAAEEKPLPWGQSASPHMNRHTDTLGDSSPLSSQVGGGHYKGLAIQPVKYIHANEIPFIEGCIIKYATRWRAKGGKEDIKKIIHFAEMLLELEDDL